MYIDCIDKFDDIPLSPQQWNAMVQKNDTNTVFQTYEWFESWWKVLGNKHRLVFLIAYDTDDIVGFVPLMLVDNLYGNKSLHFASDANADYCDFVINANHMTVISAFLKFIDTGVPEWNTMLLINIPGESITAACLQTVCQEQNYNIAIKHRVKAPTLLIGDRPEQASTLINKYSVTRHLRKIKKQGKLEFVNLSKKDEIMAYLDTFFDQHIERYRLRNMVSQFVNNDNRQLYVDMVKNFDHTDWLLFSVLLHNGKPIAFHFGFNYNNKIIWYKPSFSPLYRTYSPGTLMLRYLIKHAIKIKSEEVDFTIGDESFKSRFNNHVRYNQNLVIYRSKFICVFLTLVRRIKRNIHHGLRWARSK